MLNGGAAAAEQPGSHDFTCTLSHVATMYDSLKVLPPDLAKAVKDNLGPIADRGADFNATDVIMKPAPSRRFIRAGRTAGGNFVWYEQGGIAYWKQIVLFDGAHIAVQSRHAWSDNLCAETDKLLDGGRPLAH